MYELLLEFGAEYLALFVYAVGTVALSAVGVLAEYNGIRQFLTGEATLAAWYVYVGVVALAFAAKLGRDKILPRVAA